MQKLKKEAKEVGALMAKSQKAAEQANELRKRNEELEAVQLQLNSEKKNLQKKIQDLEEKVSEMTQSLEEAKVAAAAALAKAAEDSKTVVETEMLNKMTVQMEEKDAQLAKLQEDMAAIQAAGQDQGKKLQEAETRYQQLLKTTTLQTTAGMTMGASASMAAGRAAAFASKSNSNRHVNIQLVGASKTGKSALFEKLIQDQDPSKLEGFGQGNILSHLTVTIDGSAIKFLDCSGQARAQNMVKEWFPRSNWVFVVYDMCNKESFDYALQMVGWAHEAGARVVLFGNRFNADQGQPVQADLMMAKDVAARNNGFAYESVSLFDAVKMAMNQGDDDESVVGRTSTAAGIDGSPDVNRRSSITDALNNVKSWFGGNDRGRASQGVLRPSLKGTRAMKQQRRDGDVNSDLRPVQELQDSESAVTCICFGQERLHKAYILLATASKDGTVVIYRCYRTEMEISFLSDQDYPQEDDSAFSAPPPDHSNIAVHSKLVGHSRAITSIFFNLLEDQLVTTSIDKSVRFWGIDSGEMLKVFTDSSPVPVATFLPFNPQVFVAANSNAVLRLVNVQNGMVLQKLKVETEVRALKFDDTGLFLLAGTKSGSIHVLEASDNTSLKFKFKVQLARGGVTCICFVPANYGMPACLLVNTSDSNATIIDCTYGSPAGVLTNLTVRSRVRVAHSLLPLKCCYSPSGQGYLISGSEDKEVYIYSLAKGSNYKMQYLKHHQVPVVAVAVNMQDTVIASADSLGRIVLWRRMDFSHIPE